MGVELAKFGKSNGGDVSGILIIYGYHSTSNEVYSACVKFQVNMVPSKKVDWEKLQNKPFPKYPGATKFLHFLGFFFFKYFPDGIVRYISARNSPPLKS